jgi:hypothetical protein
VSPETLYPELLKLKPGYIFVEWVIVTSNLVVLQKIHYKKIIRARDEYKLRRKLRAKYNNNDIEFVTISKDIEEEEILITLY